MVIPPDELRRNWNSRPLQINSSVLFLERGSEELLLVDGVQSSPLYFKSGRGYIQKFLQAISEYKTAENLLEYFKDDKDLLHALIKHNICSLEKDTPLEKGLCENAGRLLSGENVDNCPKPQLGKNGISLYLLLTQYCNLGCVYCLNGSETYRKNSNLRMPESVAIKAVKKFVSLLAPRGILNIVFFGGEPLLNWKLAKKIIIYCEEELRELYPHQTITYHVTSNLSFLPKDFIEWANKYDITVLCDVDGHKDLHDQLRPFLKGHGSHDKIVENIQKLVINGIDVSMRTTVTAINEAHIPEIASHHKEIGGDSSAFVPVSPVTSDTDILPVNLLPQPDVFLEGILEAFTSGIWPAERLFPINSFIPRIKGEERLSHGCGAPYGNTPVVDVDGDVYPCIYLVGLNKYYMGNVLNNTYPRNKVTSDIMDIVDVDKTESCKDCSWRYMCGGGCPIGRLTVLGNPMAGQDIQEYNQEITCKTTKTICESLLWKYADECLINGR